MKSPLVSIVDLSRAINMVDTRGSDNVGNTNVSLGINSSGERELGD